MANPTSSTSSPVYLRLATPSDAPSISNLASTVFSATFGHSVAPHELQAFLDETYNLDATLQDLQHADKTTIVACSPEEEILGFVLLTRNSTDPCLSHVPQATLIELQRLYVSTSCHGKGIGKMLTRRVEEVAWEEGYKDMWLGVWEENARAIGVYERLGYKRVGEHDFVVGGVVQTDWIMVKKL